MSVAVFYLKYEVTDLETELDRLNRTIVADREAIHVLEAEWSHLNEAERIRALTEKYLEMNPTRPDQITEPTKIPQSPGGTAGAGHQVVPASAVKITGIQ